MSDWLPFARVLKPHGIKGAFKVRTDSDFKAKRYTPGATLKIKTPTGTHSVTVETYDDLAAGEVLKVKESNDRDHAFSFRGGTLYFDRATREDLEEDAYYYDQLENAKVYIKETLVGHVKALHDYPQGTMLRIERSGKDALVPFLKAFIEKVDMDGPTIYLKEWEGLL